METQSLGSSSDGFHSEQDRASCTACDNWQAAEQKLSNIFNKDLWEKMFYVQCNAIKNAFKGVYSLEVTSLSGYLC